MLLSSLQTASQLDSIGSGQVDIKYEDYPFTPTSMAQHSWCALSEAWVGTDYTRTALLTLHNSLWLHHGSHTPSFSWWRNCVAWTFNWSSFGVWWLHVLAHLTWRHELTFHFINWNTIAHQEHTLAHQEMSAQTAVI